MDYDISKPVPQGGDGAQDAENSRIAAIANELERLCAVHEAQLGDSQADVSRFETEQRATSSFLIQPIRSMALPVSTVVPSCLLSFSHE